MSRQRTTSGQIDIQNLSIRLGQADQAFDAVQDLSLQIQPGEFVCVLGPSGCGKSTLLGVLAGHLQPSQGQARIDDQAIQGPSPDLGIVFQQHTLFPWYRVLDNLAFGLKMKGIAKAQRYQAARDMLQLVGLQQFEQAYPNQLSGGMQQRVEIARVLINRPRVLLMDEPFGALDALTRLKMQQLLLDIWQKIGTTVVFITHDIDEALFLADRILVMSPRPGRIIEDIRLDFERPRHTELLSSPAFGSLKRHCLQLLQDPTHTRPLPILSPLGLPAEPVWRLAL